MSTLCSIVLTRCVGVFIMAVRCGGSVRSVAACVVVVGWILKHAFALALPRPLRHVTSHVKQRRTPLQTKAAYRLAHQRTRYVWHVRPTDRPTFQQVAIKSVNVASAGRAWHTDKKEINCKRRCWWSSRRRRRLAISKQKQRHHHSRRSGSQQRRAGTCVRGPACTCTQRTSDNHVFEVNVLSTPEIGTNTNNDSGWSVCQSTQRTMVCMYGWWLSGVVLLGGRSIRHTGVGTPTKHERTPKTNERTHPPTLKVGQSHE